VYFKHKYITQTTVTPADAIVKAFHDLMATLKGTTNLKGQQNLDAITQLQTTLSPPVTPQPQSPRVNFRNTIQLRTFDPNGVTPLAHLPPPQLIVESPLATAPLLTSSDTQRPLVTSPSLSANPDVSPTADIDSIATHVALRRHTPTNPNNDSIAACLLARCHEVPTLSLTWKPDKPWNTDISSVTPNSKTPGTFLLPMNLDALHKV
jgi:hypothetical protein